MARSTLDSLATKIERTTIVSGALVKEGEAILLTFDRVRGQAFERTIRVATDLSARMGKDLTSSIRAVGTALQDPVGGLNSLRQAGVQFTDEQKGLIKGFVETNQAARAQNLILGELERRFAGSAAAARGTLGGSLTGLKQAFSGLFELTSESTTSSVAAINELSATLNAPATKTGFGVLIGNLAKIVELTAKGASGLGGLQTKLVELAQTKGPTASGIRSLLAAGNPFLAPLALLAESSANASDTRTRGPTGIARGRGNRPGIDTGGAVAALEEINVTVRKITDLNRDALRELEESTRTSVERVSAEYSKLKATLQTLFDEGLISRDQFNERLQGGITDVLGLEEIDLNEIRSKYITLKRETSELGEYMRGVWQSVGRANHAMLSDVLHDWKISWSKVIDIARRALSDIGAAIIQSGIRDALKGQLGTGELAKLFGLIGGDQTQLADSFFAFLPTKAGGGRFDGPTIVGEDGPELVTGTGHVFNKRQMAFAGGGGPITYAPVTNIQIIEREDPQQTKRELIQYVETRTAQQQAEFTRTLGRSGIEVRG